MTYLQTVIGLDLYCPDVAGQRPIVSDLRYYIRLHCVSLYALQVYGWSHEDMGPWLFLLWRTVHCIESTCTVLLADYRRLLRHTPLSDHALRPVYFVNTGYSCVVKPVMWSSRPGLASSHLKAKFSRPWPWQLPWQLLALPSSLRPDNCC